MRFKDIPRNQIMGQLCGLCRKRNESRNPEWGTGSKRQGTAPSDANCHICRGASAKLDKLVDEAAEKLLNAPGIWKKFSISTNIPKEMMAREEDAWDYGLGESVKNEFNRRIVSGLEKKTGLVYDFVRADVKVTFDLARMETRAENADIFIYGKYRKFRSDVAQSEWTCRDCNGKGCERCDYEGVKYESVEAIIGEKAKGLYGAKDAELHASGREDVDALNLAGRPFVLELRKPEKGKVDLEALRQAVNGSGEGVEISDLKYVSNSEVALVSDSHFDKAYEAEVEIEGGTQNSELETTIDKLRGMVLHQRTPHRVKHRRSDMVRKRKILDIRIARKEPLTIYVLAEAGTYIKEFISGDDGRTKPSVSEILGKKAKCIKLSVVEIKDGFLEDVIEDRYV